MTGKYPILGKADGVTAKGKIPSVEAIGHALKTNINCGYCLPEWTELLATELK